MEENERSVLTEMLLMLDKYDLYGKMAIPKNTTSNTRSRSSTRSPPPREASSLTRPLPSPSAYAHRGVGERRPIVATDDGGPGHHKKLRKRTARRRDELARDRGGDKKNSVRQRTVEALFGQRYNQCPRALFLAAHVTTYLEKVGGLCADASSTDFSAEHGDTAAGRSSPPSITSSSRTSTTPLSRRQLEARELMNLLAENRERIGFGSPRAERSIRRSPI